MKYIELAKGEGHRKVWNSIVLCRNPEREAYWHSTGDIISDLYLTVSENRYRLLLTMRLNKVVKKKISLHFSLIYTQLFIAFPNKK